MRQDNLRLAVGDGALGFWAAVGEIYPETRPQRSWVHKTANVLNYLPKSLQPKAKPSSTDTPSSACHEDRAIPCFDPVPNGQSRAPLWFLNRRRPLVFGHRPPVD